MMLLPVGWLACTGTEQIEPLVPMTPQISRDESVEDNKSSAGSTIPPGRNSVRTMGILESIAAGEVLFTQFKGCYIPASSEGDAPKGHFLYAWNEMSTVGLVLSIHHLPIEEMPIGTVKELSVAERDAFMMIEIGERIDTNFCTPNIQQIPVATVLESQTGSVQIKRTEIGVEANIGALLFRDQYTKQEVTFAGLVIPSQALDRPVGL